MLTKSQGLWRFKVLRVAPSLKRRHLRSDGSRMPCFFSHADPAQRGAPQMTPCAVPSSEVHSTTPEYKIVGLISHFLPYLIPSELVLKARKL